MAWHQVKTRRQAGVGFIVCTILALGVIFLAHWEPRADFDVVGVLWVMQNALPFTILCVLIAGAIGALCVWLKCGLGGPGRDES